MVINKVINLGHMAQQPLMYLRSELGDGFEPHDHITPVHGPAPTADSMYGVRVGCTRGGGLGGYLGGVYRGTQPRARLRLIYGI